MFITNEDKKEGKFLIKAYQKIAAKYGFTLVIKDAAYPMHKVKTEISIHIENGENKVPNDLSQFHCDLKSTSYFKKWQKSLPWNK